MFRLKIALSFVLLISLLVGTTYFTIHSQLGNTLRSDAAISLQRASLIAEQSSRLDEFSLLEKARFVAARPELNQAMTAEYEGDAEYERHMAVHRWLERDQIAFTDIKPEQDRNLDRSLMQRAPLHQELFTAIDASGYGVATLGKDLLSWFGDNVAKQHPIILDVMNKGEARTDVWLWSYNPTEAKQLYIVAIAPIRASPNAPVLGVVVLGNAINNGVAQASKARMGDATATPISNNQRATDLAPELAIFHGENIYGSTFNPTQQRELADLLLKDHAQHAARGANTPVAIELDGKPYDALVRYFSNNSDPEIPAGFILLSNTGAVQNPLATAKSNILTIAAIVLVAGIALFFFFFYQFTRPLMKIESGINEIITGNKDYEFAVQTGNEYAAGLSHALNQMSAFLQGKSLDEDSNPAGWDELMPEAATSLEERKHAAPTIKGVAMPSSMAPAQAEPAEPARPAEPQPTTTEEDVS